MNTVKSRSFLIGASRLRKTNAYTIKTLLLPYITGFVDIVHNAHSFYSFHIQHKYIGNDL